MYSQTRMPAAPASAPARRHATRAVSTIATLALLFAVLALAPSPMLAQAPPATPDSVSVTRADGTLTASWDAVDGATSYWITYSSDGGASWSLAALNHTEASITVSPVTNSATYIVGVRARNDHGDSGWRNSPAAGPFVPTPPPTVSAALTIADADADEGNALAFTVRLDNAVPGGFTVTPTFTDGATVPGGDLSALTARQGSDYRASQVTLDFAGTAGETVTFTVPTIEDGTAEYPELFTVGLAVSGTTHSVTATDTATGIIRDDDTAASAGAGIASNSQLQDKGSSWWLWSPPAPGTVWMDYYCEIPKRVVETTNRAIRSKVFQIPCKLGGIATGAVVEMWSTGSATATNGGSNWDYKFYHNKLNMYPGDKGTQRHDFLINDDQVVEAAESFQFALKWTTKIGYPPFYFTVNESLHVLTVYIDDDDAYQLSVSPDSVSEGGGAKTVTVTATNVGGAKLSEDRTIDVQVGAAADHAVEGTDYQTVNNFDLTIPKGSSSAHRHLHPDAGRRHPPGGGRAHHGVGQQRYQHQRAQAATPDYRFGPLAHRQRDHHPERDTGRQRGRRRTDGDRHGDGEWHGAAGHTGDGVGGQERRRRSVGNRLRRGVRLHPHHPVRVEERHGDVPTDADQRHDPGE